MSCPRLQGLYIKFWSRGLFHDDLRQVGERAGLHHLGNPNGLRTVCSKSLHLGFKKAVSVNKTQEARRWRASWVVCLGAWAVRDAGVPYFTTRMSQSVLRSRNVEIDPSSAYLMEDRPRAPQSTRSG